MREAKEKTGYNTVVFLGKYFQTIGLLTGEARHMAVWQTSVPEMPIREVT
jgi:hypothetical protein